MRRERERIVRVLTTVLLGVVLALAAAVLFGCGGDGRDGRDNRLLSRAQAPPPVAAVDSHGRCGLPDQIQTLLGAGAVCQWPKGYTVRLYNGLGAFGGFTADEVDRAYRSAAASWVAISGLRVSFVKAQAGSDIYSLPGRIDGRGGTLAWSYLPCGPGPLEQRYDTGENWRQYGLDYLTACIAHELGHAFGLEHLSPRNLMQPWIEVGLVKPQAGDTAAIRLRYGTAPAPPPDPTPLPPAPNPTQDIPLGTFDSPALPPGRYQLLLRPAP